MIQENGRITVYKANVFGKYSREDHPRYTSDTVAWKNIQRIVYTASRFQPGSKITHQRRCATDKNTLPHRYKTSGRSDGDQSNPVPSKI